MQRFASFRLHLPPSPLFRTRERHAEAHKKEAAQFRVERFLLIYNSFRSRTEWLLVLEVQFSVTEFNDDGAFVVHATGDNLLAQFVQY